MASKKISQLSSSLAPPLSGVTVVVHDGTTYKSTLSAFRQALVDSGSHSFTGSQFIGGNLTVSGSVTAQQFILSSSIANIVTETISGSSNFGNSLDDRHVFTGSVKITGSLDTIGDLTITGKIPSLIVGTGSFHVDNPEILHVQNSGSFNIAHFEANNGYYAQINIKNTNSGSFASSDLVLTADNGNEIVHYVDLGINSSTYNGGAVGYGNDSYLINAGKDMYIGTLGGIFHPAEVKLFTMGNWINPHMTLHTGSTISFNTDTVSEGYEYEFSGSLNLLHNININGITNLGSTSETIVPLNDSTVEYIHDFISGSILYITGATSNISIDIVNVPTNNNKGIGLTVMIEQGSTPYMVDSLKINSEDEGSVAIMWYGGTMPSGNTNSYDIVSFSILKINSLWKVFGQITSFSEGDTPPPSPTPTATVTITPTSTVTPTPTPSLTPTNSQTPTMSPTPSETPTMTPSGTPGATPSETPSMTPSETPTMTPTMTPSETPTMTPSETPTMTPSETPTMTPSETPTMTPSETPTMTPSETPTMTPSETPTMTPSETPTMTPSETPTMTPSETPTMTPSETPTMTPSETPTMTPSETPTMTPSETPTMTMTPSETPTMTPSETPTMTMTPSETPTMTPTMTMTPSETPTMSITPSETPTMTPTMTMTPSPTSPPITLGDWFLTGDEGLYSGQTGTTLNFGGNIFFTNGPSNDPLAFTVSFNPNFVDSNTVIRFSTKNSADVEYFTLFENFRVNGGTISLTQNGNTASYTLNPNLLVISDQGSYKFFVFNASASVTQIQQSPVSFVKNVPITVTLRG